MEKLITQKIMKRVRGQNRAVGMFVGAIDTSGNVHIGWSKVAVTKGDTFDKKRGMNIAMGRMIHSAHNVNIKGYPRSMQEDMRKFIDRCRRYFKGCKAIYPMLRAE